MLKVKSLNVGPPYDPPPLVASKLVDESSKVAPALWTPSISTKTPCCFPKLLAMVQAGPGECQPDGVGPGVNHLFASPPLTVVVIPGLNGLALKEAVPV